MTVGAEKLIRMAREIAANVTVDTNPDVVAARVADHLRRYWDPRMRAELIASAESDAAGDIDPLILATIEKLRADA